MFHPPGIVVSAKVCGPEKLIKPHRIPVGGEVLCLKCEQGIWTIVLQNRSLQAHSACLDNMNLWLILQFKEDFGKTFLLQQDHTLLHFSIL